jgi:hypothetical protein
VTVSKELLSSFLIFLRLQIPLMRESLFDNLYLIDFSKAALFIVFCTGFSY